MDVMHVTNEKLDLFIGGVRIEVLQELEEQGFEGWDHPDEILPYAVCEALFQKIAAPYPEGYGIAQCEFTFLFNEMAEYALKSIEASDWWNDDD